MNLPEFEDGLLFLSLWSLFDLVEGEREPPVPDSHGPVDAVLHDNLLHRYPVLYLVEPPVVLYDAIVSHRPLRLDAEGGIKVPSFYRPVEVPSLLRGDGKPSVIPGKIGDEEPVCLSDGTDAGQPHLLYQAILECFEEPLDPSLCLGGTGMDQLDAKLLQGPAEFAHRLRAGKLIFGGGCGRRFVGGVLIQIDLHGKAVLFDIAPEAVHGGDGSLVFIEPAEHPAACVVDIAHEDAFGTPVFEPVMMGAVHLEH